MGGERRAGRRTPERRGDDFRCRSPETSQTGSRTTKIVPVPLLGTGGGPEMRFQFLTYQNRWDTVTVWGLGGQQGLGPAYRLPCVGRHQVPPSIRPTDPRGHSVQPDARSPVGVTQTSRPARLWPGSFTLLFSGLSGAHKTLTREAPLPCKGGRFCLSRQLSLLSPSPGPLWGSEEGGGASGWRRAVYRAGRMGKVFSILPREGVPSSLGLRAVWPWPR